MPLYAHSYYRFLKHDNWVLELSSKIILGFTIINYYIKVSKLLNK